MSELAQPPAPRQWKRNKRRTMLLVFAALLLAAVLVLVAVLANAAYVENLARNFDTKAHTIPQAFPSETLRPVKATEGPAAEALNMLLLGSDSRGDALTLAEAGEPSNQRSDTMMWVHIPADRQEIFLVSIMRDMWVEIPGYGEAKINAAMAYGGVPLVVETLEGMFKNRIDHVAIVDFAGFKAITDALGGVEVKVPMAFTSRHGGIPFKAGPQLLNGDQALAFVRERYAFIDGDYQRVKNQQIFLRSLLSAILAPGTRTNPLKVTALVDQLAPYLSVDSGLDSAALGELAGSLSSVRGANVSSFTLPSRGTGTSADGQSIVLRDDATIALMAAALTKDSMATYLKEVRSGYE